MQCQQFLAKNYFLKKRIPFSHEKPDIIVEKHRLIYNDKED